jgi:hypothetical protein
MVELHSNFTAHGSKMVQDRMLSANPAEHETVEVTLGFNSRIEVGFYIFTSIPPNLVVRKSSLLARVAKHVLATAILTFVLNLGVIPAFSQMNIAEISGLVEDPSGAAVANATVKAVAIGTQLKYTATSNPSGEFLLGQLPVGVYKLTAAAKRFQQSVMSDITVHAGLATQTRVQERRRNAFTYGNAGRDIVTGRGLDDFDATLQKEFLVRENMKLQFRWDVFNFFNHPNFNNPVGAGRTFSTAASFGAITSAQDPRDMQFSLRLAY